MLSPRTVCCDKASSLNAALVKIAAYAQAMHLRCWPEGSWCTCAAVELVRVRNVRAEYNKARPFSCICCMRSGRKEGQRAVQAA